MTDERNFRSSYYEKVGCRGVEEKKSLEILLKEKPWDKVKLKHFCLRFSVPAAYRIVLWKVLLGVLPVYTDSHQFVNEQRTGQYDDLMHALQVMELVCEKDTRANVLCAMWHLESGRMYCDPAVKQSLEKSFVPIADTLLELYDDEVDVYWLAKGFCGIVANYQKDLPRLLDLVRSLLEKEDQELYNHLKQVNVWDALPLDRWFNCCFAGVLDDSSLAKIWDKLCGGAPKVLSFVAVLLLITLRRGLLRAETPEQVLKCVAEMPEQCEEVVANKAIELWQYYGAQPQGDSIAKK